MAGVHLTVVANEIEAEVVCGLLRANGIECAYRTTNLAAGLADGSSSQAGPREILVDEQSFDAAQELLAQD
jgi:hypothetical protein